MLFLNCIHKISVDNYNQFFKKDELVFYVRWWLYVSWKPNVLKGQQSSSLDKMLLIFLGSK